MIINEPIIVLLIIVFLSILFYKAKSISLTGIIAGDLVALIAYFGFLESGFGLAAFLLILIFYISAEVVTNIGRTKNVKKHERRTTSNIIGNCGAAVISIFAGNLVAFFGAVSAALADTASSEIGMMSKKRPVLITNFKKKVPMGTDGGVTALGSVAGLICAWLVGLYYYFLTQNLFMFLGIVIAGFSGSMVDSLLGATLERKGKLNNTQVNFLASLSGALIAFAINLL